MTYRWARRGAPVVALFAMLLLTLAGCGRNPPSSGRPAEDATLAVAKLPHSALVYIARAKGYYSEEGLNLTFLDHVYGKEAMESLLAGKADFATAAEGPIMFAVMNGDRIVLVSVLTINRIPADAVRRIDVKPDDNLAALSEGRIDAVATWNPHVLQLSRTLGDRGIVFYSGEAYTETLNIAASRKMVQENPGIVNKLLRAVAKAAWTSLC